MGVSEGVKLVLTRVVGSRWPNSLVIVPWSNDFIDDLLLSCSEVSVDWPAEGMEGDTLEKVSMSGEFE